MGVEWVAADGGTSRVLVGMGLPALGIGIDPSRNLIFATTQNAIVSWSLKDGQQERVLARTKAANCLTVDTQRARVYWGDSELQQVLSCDYQGEDLRVLATGIASPDAVAVNSSRGLIYWAQGFSPDNLHQGVWMARTDGTDRRQISTETNVVSALAVDERSGTVFWVRPALGPVPAMIIAAQSDGSQPKAIVNMATKYRFIEGLAVDEEERRIVWIERSGGDDNPQMPALIRSALFDGTSSTNVLTFTDGSHARSVAVGPPRRK